MRKFQYQYSKTIKILIYVGLVLSVLGFAINLWRMIELGTTGFYTTLQYILIFAVTITLPIVLISMLISSVYLITDKELVTKFGIIKSKFRLEDVHKIIYQTDKNKLNIYFKDDTYMNILVNEAWHQEFIGAILEKRKNIEVEYTAGEENE